MLLVGGASRRFGSPKALVEVDGERLVDRGSRVLAEVCDEVLVVGKPGELPFDVLPDAGEVRAPIAGVVAGLRAAAHDVVVFLPGRLSVDDRRGAARTGRRLPRRGGAANRPAARCLGEDGAARARAPPASGPYALYRAYDELDVAVVQLDPRVVADVDTPADLRLVALVLGAPLPAVADAAVRRDRSWRRAAPRR